MKKQIYRLLLLALAAVLLSGCAPSGSASPAPSPSEQYRIEKLNDISDLILERAVIPSDYFRYAADDARLLADIRLYNEQTGQLTLAATGYATSILSGLVEGDQDTAAQLSGAVWDHLKASEVFHEMERRIAHLSLYENAEELCRADPLLAHLIVPELGGSWGMWPSWLHTFGSAGDPNYQTLFQEYLELIDALMDGLDAARDSVQVD